MFDNPSVFSNSPLSTNLTLTITLMGATGPCRDKCVAEGMIETNGSCRDMCTMRLDQMIVTCSPSGVFFPGPGSLDADGLGGGEMETVC